MNNTTISPSENYLDEDSFLDSLTKDELNDYIDMMITADELYFNLNNDEVKSYEF